MPGSSSGRCRSTSGTCARSGSTSPATPTGSGSKARGPNRFWCELAGKRSGDAARVDVRLGAAVFWRMLVLDLENHGDEPVTLRLKALAFGDRKRSVRLRPGRSRTVEWDTDRGWYDVEVTAMEDRAFRRRFTGRVETGRAGVTP